MADTEKITINMSVVDLGQIDLLVEQGFYSTRTDFIRAAVRRQLQTHNPEIKDTIARKSIVMGMIVYSKEDLEKILAKNEKIDIRALGLFMLHANITTELAIATIRSVQVFGVFRASAAVKDALKDRTL